MEISIEPDVLAEELRGCGCDHPQQLHTKLEPLEPNLKVHAGFHTISRFSSFYAFEAQEWCSENPPYIECLRKANQILFPRRK